jgi:hypothetical protein
MRGGRLEVTNSLTIAVRWDRIDAAFRNGAIADLALLDITALLERAQT